MNFKNFLDTDKILFGLTADNQRSAMEKLISPLAKAGNITDPEVFLKDLQQRETEVTTVMDNGVAIPHARSHVVKRLALVVGLLDEKGVRFNPDSDVESRLIFCISIPQFAPTSHLPLLQTLAKFSQDPKRVEKVLNYKTINGVIRFLSSFKG